MLAGLELELRVVVDVFYPITAITWSPGGSGRVGTMAVGARGHGLRDDFSMAHRAVKDADPLEVIAVYL
jgi:hypothetical protein